MALFVKSTRRLPTALYLIIILSFVLSSVGIWWGILPGSPEDWASDTILPSDVHQATSRLFQNGWYSRYPPFHFELLSALYSPFFALHFLNYIDITSYPTYTTLLFLGRLLTLALSLILVVLVYLWAQELGVGVRGAIFAAAITSFNPIFAFYSKTTNLDVPYTMWFVASMLFLTRAIRGNKQTDYILFAVFATLAICTKDQAYGLYVLIVPVVLFSSYKIAREQSSGALESGIWVAKSLFLPAIISGALFIIIYLIPFNIDGFEAHFKLIVGPASENYRIYENSLSGHFKMMVQSIKQVSFAMGWWLAAVCFLGVIRELRRNSSDRLIWLPFVSIVSYYVFFISVVGYNNDRFFLPILVSLSIYGGKLLTDLWEFGLFYKLARVAIILTILAYSWVYAFSVDTLMIADSRYKALEWLNTHLESDDLISGVGETYYLPPLFSFKTEHFGRRPSVELVSEVEPTYIVTSSIFGEEIFEEGSKGHFFFTALNSGELGYDLAFQYQGRSFYSLLNREGVFTNLDKINPEIRIFRKVQ